MAGDYDIEMLGQGRGILQVEDMQQCWREIADLLEQPERAQALGREARSRLAREPDVVSQYLDALEPWL